MTLKISPDLSLPMDAATTKMGILAVSGAGKSFTGRVIAEEMIASGIQVVAVDPVGVWWGLRAGASPKDKGLPVVLFGGDPNDARRIAPDVALHETHGELVADLIVDGSFSCVLDLSGFPSKAAERRFLTDFARRLYRRNRSPLHLFLDEADSFAPQKPQKDETRVLGAIQEIVRRGRARGLGCTLISQRAASLSKDVLTQIETLIAMRTTSPQDRAAIDAWVQANASNEERNIVMKSLASLKTGEAWVWSPSWLQILKRVKIRKCSTFDSSATPKVGEKLVAPKTLVAVDIEALRKALAVEPEPETKAKGKRNAVVVTVSDPALVAERDRLRAALATEQTARRFFQVRAEKAVRSLNELQTITVNALAMLPAEESAAEAIMKLQAVGEYVDQPNGSTPDHLRIDPGIRPRRLGRGTVVHDDSGPALMRGAREILRVIAASPQPLTRDEVAVLSLMTASSGTFSNYLGALSGQRYITKVDGRLTVTESGLARCGNPGLLPTTADLVQRWGANGLMAGTRRILDHLISHYPNGVSRTELAKATNHEPTSGTYSNYLGALVGKRLAERRNGHLYAGHALFIGDKS